MITHFDLATGRVVAADEESAPASWSARQTVETRLLSFDEAKALDSPATSSIMPADLAGVSIDRILARFSGY